MEMIVARNFVQSFDFFDLNYRYSKPSAASAALCKHYIIIIIDLFNYTKESWSLLVKLLEYCFRRRIFRFRSHCDALRWYDACH